MLWHLFFLFFISLYGDTMKKFFLILIILLIPFGVYADSGHSTIVMEVSSGRVLYSKNASDPKLIASITKIMTCLVVLENANLTDKVTVGDEVLSMYGTNIYLEVGEVMSVKDLLYGLMMRSGNDAALVLAIATMGSEEKFVEKMNEKAQKIGMKDTIFQNSHGLDEETQNISTAYDMALLSQYAYRNSEYRNIIQTKKYRTKSSLKSYLWYNRMSLLNEYDYCIGGKNGYTPRAGKTLVSVAKKNDMILTIVSLDDSDIYQNHKRLYQHYFSEYQLYNILNKNDFTIFSSFIPENVYIKESFYYPLRLEELDEVKEFISIKEIDKKQQIGSIIIRLKDEKIGEVFLYQKRKKELSFFEKIKSLFLRYSKKIYGRS